MDTDHCGVYVYIYFVARLDVGIPPRCIWLAI